VGSVVAASRASLTIARGPRGSVVTRAYAEAPLKWLTPASPRGAAWAFASSYGGGLATNVLTDPVLRRQWEGELAGMRDRVKSVRRQLVEKIRALRADFDMSYVIEQRGMFSYSGLTPTQVGRLRDEYSIYALESGRVCVAALNSRNVDYVAQAIADVLVA